MKTLKVLSALLAYPSSELMAAAPELKAALAEEAVLPPRHLNAVSAFIDGLAAGDLFDAQERYLLLFDRTRSLSLHLFEHIHGESRDRGQAMVDLKSLYERGGFVVTSSELPDFVPLFLEFASTLPPREALELVAEPGHVLAALEQRLLKRRSPCAAVFSALVALADVELDSAQIEALKNSPDADPDELEALDAAWEEEEVRFGPAASSGCGHDDLVAKLRQARRPASGLRSAAGPRPRTIVTHSRSSGN